jgi:hypothetical protein
MPTDPVDRAITQYYDTPAKSFPIANGADVKGLPRMKRWPLRAALTALMAGALAVAISVLIVDTANGTPHQPNVPVFTYGSQ